ncbi:protein kinase domain-containing protein [Parendozoicomonas haliclonae]|uniref:Protein kinase domain protein n=1 Tax=Parendozoicomonas haliclonae TaxID=1960125 RepID=A0A1X7AI61_9GAMM|nr:protein kinase [Parendozoicomonas haliclonae]SMA43070.1 Protein kinase domain protein [Parendozoicomonas haliclonae]
MIQFTCSWYTLPPPTIKEADGKVSIQADRWLTYTPHPDNWEEQRVQVRTTVHCQALSRQSADKMQGILAHCFEALWDHNAMPPLAAGTFGMVKQVPCEGLVFKVNHDPLDYDNAINEGKTQFALNHKALMPCLGYVLAPDVQRCLLFYPMAHCTLAQRINSIPEVPFVWLHRLETFVGITEGVQYLHNNNLVHNDLHYPNVMLTERGHPLISDFGAMALQGTPNDNVTPSSEKFIAQFNGLPVKRELTSNHLHLPPEFYTGPTLEYTADIFMLGVLLTGLLEGTLCELAWTNHPDCKFNNCPAECRHFLWPAPQRRQKLRCYPGHRKIRVDSDLHVQYPENALKARELASHCLKVSPQERPSSAMAVGQVVEEILISEQPSHQLFYRDKLRPAPVWV